MWEMVATQRLFKAENDLATLQLVMHKPPPALTALRPDCPAELDRIIQRALAQDPEQRYQTAQALQRDLDELARETKLDQSPIALGAHMAVLFGPEIEAWQLAQAAGTSLADHVVAAAAVAAQEVTGGSQPFDDSDDDDNDEEPFVPPTQMTHVEVDAERTERTEPPVVAAPAPAPRRKRKKAKEPSGWKSEPSIVIEDALMTVGTPLPQAAPDVEPTAVTPTPRPARAQSPAARTQLVAAVAPPKRNNRWITVLALAVSAASAAVAYVVVSHDRAPNPAANVEPPKAAPASVLAEPAHAEPANVEPANSAPANAEPAKPAAKLEPANAEPAKPAAKLEPAKPEPAKPEAAKLEPAKLEPAKPAAKLEPAKVAAPKPPRHVARPTPARHVDKPAPKPKFDPDAPLPPM
jgi:hypothetical protein